MFETMGQITRVRLGQNLKDRFGHRILKDHVDTWLSGLNHVGNGQILSFQSYADKYGEQVTDDPIADLRAYFSGRLTGATRGGITTGVQSLSIPAARARPSTTAIATVGEAVAGWYMETQRCLLPLARPARPIGEGPDFIFEHTGLPRYSLVQVKSTVNDGIRSAMVEAAMKFLDYTSKVALAAPTHEIETWVIGVFIASENDCELSGLRIELR